MEFIEQVKDVKVVEDVTPRVYLSWSNTEDGRDKNDCYERIKISDGNFYYVNTNNRNSTINNTHPFYTILDKMYNDATSKKVVFSTNINKIEKMSDLPPYGMYVLVNGVDMQQYGIRRWHVCEMNDLEDGMDFAENGNFYWLTESGRKVIDVTEWCYLPK